MHISQVPVLVFPMLVFTIGLVLIIYYSKKSSETEYEQEMKQLRQMQLSGKLDKKRFLRIKNRLTIDKSSSDQREILENMLKDEKIDAVTYTRMKKALKFSLNQKLKKNNTLN